MSGTHPLVHASKEAALDSPTSSSQVTGDLDSPEFIRALRAGEPSAMERFLNCYQDRLFNAVLRIVANHDDAADITQEALMQMLQHIDQFSGQSSLYTWVFRITTNQALSHCRKGKLRRTISLAQDDTGDNMTTMRPEPCAGPDSDPAGQAEIKLDHPRVMTAMAGMPVEFRTLLVLRDVEECGYDQIAKITDLPVGTVKSRLFRARQALRSMLEESSKSSAVTGMGMVVNATSKAGKK